MHFLRVRFKCLRWSKLTYLNFDVSDAKTEIIDTEGELKKKKKYSEQVRFGACYSLISLKQQQSKQTSRRPIDFVAEAAFGGAALMDAFRAYSFISSKPGIISLLRHTAITLFLFFSGGQVLSFQTRPSLCLL